MSGSAWPVVLLVLAAAAVIGWPAGGVRSRRRALFPSAGPVGPTGAPRSGHLPRWPRSGPLRATGWRTPVGPPNRRDLTRPPAGEASVPDGTVTGPGAVTPRPAAWPGGVGVGPTAVDRAAPGCLPEADAGARGIGRWRRVPRGRTVLLAGIGAAVAGLLAGPVAATVTAAYTGLGTRALSRRRAAMAADRLRRRRLDDLGALAADLRAGLPVPVTLAEEGTGPSAGSTGLSAATHRRAVDRFDRLTRAAVRLADRTGAPLAELLERVEADARAMDRGLAAAAAQAAGARATAWLLAALPLGGIALGYTVGVDPVGVLLHTPVGAVCALGATGLQAVGLFWAERLAAPPGQVR